MYELSFRHADDIHKSIKTYPDFASLPRIVKENFDGNKALEVYANPIRRHSVCIELEVSASIETI